MNEILTMFAGIGCTFGLTALIWIMAMVLVDGVLMPLDKWLNEHEED